MKTDEKNEIIKRARNSFREVISANHLSGLNKLTTLSSFNYNPFLVKYLAYFLEGNSNPKSIARALIYPRVLGTSINTIFGNQAQKFCKDILPGIASVIQGIDIEFTDQIDQRKKYCQIKASTQTVNHDDVKTISDHFIQIKRLAHTNGLDLNVSDMIVGILYGDLEELKKSGHFSKIKESYPVFVGEEFWYRLTGDKSFYLDLIQAFGEESKLINGKRKLEKVVQALAEDIEKNSPELSQ